MDDLDGHSRPSEMARRDRQYIISYQWSVAEMDMGPIYWIQSDPTHYDIDPTEPNNI